MNAWVFAGALFVVILGFEFLMFRYIGHRGSSTAGTDRTGTTSAATGADAGGSAAAGVEDGPRGEPAGDATTCLECGAPNDDTAMVRYCQHCLARLR